MNTTGKIAVGITLAALLGTSGYYGRQYYVCRGLEEDYLNAVSRFKNAYVVSAAIPDKRLVQVFEKLGKAGEADAEKALLGLYQQCGKRAAETANRKSQSAILQ